MNKFLSLLVVLATTLSAFSITLDGKLDEPQWQSAEEHTDFGAYQGGNQVLVMPRTSFRIINDGANIFIGVHCTEPEMSKLVAPVKEYPWKSDLIEIFMSPSCRQDEFYQFVVSAGNVRWCEYYGEGGNIRPDPGFAPIWESAVFKGPDFWSLEVRIPLAAFYHTRNSQWQNTWLFNMTRDRNPGGANGATWSPLVNNNQESFRYRKLGGFPSRKPVDDLFIESVLMDVTEKNGPSYTGKLKLTILSGLAGERQLTYGEQKTTIQLRQGRNILSLPCSFNKQGRQYTPFILDNGNTIGRTYPVQVQYAPISIQLTQPGYSNTFYPGQDKSKVKGILRLRKAGTVTLLFEGEGLKTQKLTFNTTENSFCFDSAAIGPKGATLTASTKSDTLKVRVGAPTPTARRMAWIENGKLIVNGKPFFVREIEGVGNYTGRKFNEIFNKERNSFHINNELSQHITIEPRLMVKGIETEAVLDKEPSKVLLDKMTQVIEKNRDRDFTFYMLVDEPECRNISPIYLEYLYKHIKSLDPFHPVKLCTREPARFAKCADYITMHPYWSPYFDAQGNRIHSDPLEKVQLFFEGWQTPDKASSLTPQVFSYRNFWNRRADYPTVDEMESAIWSAIICGASGIHAYHYHDLGDRAVLFEGMRYIMTSLERLEPFILSTNIKRLPAPPKTLAALFTNADNTLLVLVNPTAKSVEMNAPFKNMVEFGGKSVFNGKVKLKPFQSKLYTNVKMDQGLQTKEEVMTRIAQQEKVRLSTKNIFLEKGFDINVSVSGFNHFNPRDWTQSKLFDGTFDSMAWGHSQFRDSWVELGFAKFTPTFTQLILHGFNMEKVTVKYWKDGQWNDLKTLASATHSQYKTVFTCKSAVRTVKLRLEFPKNDLPYELYEIEAYNDNNIGNAVSEAQNAPTNDMLYAKENILWKQDGTNIVLGPKGWKCKQVKVYANQEGKFTVCSNYSGKPQSPTTDCYIPISKDYPWLVFRLNSVKDTDADKYHAWCIQGPTMGAFFQDISPIPGIYAINLSEKQDISKIKLSYIVIYAYAQEMVFDNITIGKKMECMLSSKFEDDGISVTAQLLTPAESVSVRVCHRFKAITNELQLKPADDQRLLWKGSFKFDTPLKSGKTTSFPAGGLELRADVLGGSVTVPVFTKIFQAYPVK